MLLFGQFGTLALLLGVIVPFLFVIISLLFRAVFRVFAADFRVVSVVAVLLARPVLLLDCALRYGEDVTRERVILRI